MRPVPLEGLRVLTCRQDGRDKELHQLIRSAGGTVVHLPLIKITVPDDAGEALGGALATLAGNEWLACTSANGVAAVADALARMGALLPTDVRIAAVGPATAAAFEAHLGRTPDLVPERATAADLGEAFPPGPGRVIAPLASLANDDLAVVLVAKGYDVTVVAAYDTISPPLSANEIADAKASDVAVLASPSAVDRLAARLGTPLPMPIVAIGPRSAGAAAAVTSEIVIESADTSALSVFNAVLTVLR